MKSIKLFKGYLLSRENIINYIAYFVIIVIASSMFLNITVFSDEIDKSSYYTIFTSEILSFVIILSLGIGTFREMYRISLQNSISRKTLQKVFLLFIIIFSVVNTVILSVSQIIYTKCLGNEKVWSIFSYTLNIYTHSTEHHYFASAIFLLFIGIYAGIIGGLCYLLYSRWKVRNLVANLLVWPFIFFNLFYLLDNFELENYISLCVIGITIFIITIISFFVYSKKLSIENKL